MGSSSGGQPTQQLRVPLCRRAKSLPLKVVGDIQKQQSGWAACQAGKGSQNSSDPPESPRRRCHAPEKKICVGIRWIAVEQDLATIFAFEKSGGDEPHSLDAV